MALADRAGARATGEDNVSSSPLGISEDRLTPPIRRTFRLVPLFPRIGRVRTTEQIEKMVAGAEATATRSTALLRGRRSCTTRG